MPSIFISHSSKHPDIDLATELHDKLKAAGLHPFLASKSIQWGERWADRISQEIDTCDYLLVLLSKRSSTSDMVTEEIRLAREMFQKRGKPAIIPVRISMEMNEGWNYDIGGYLNSIQQRFWEGEEDTPKLVNELVQLVRQKGDNTISGEDSADCKVPAIQLPDDEVDLPKPNAPLVYPSGMVALDSPYYVERSKEQMMINEAAKPGALIRLKGPRQFGKTSMLSRIIRNVEEKDHVVVALSCQQFDSKTLADEDLLLQRICYMTTKKLKLQNRIKEYWDNDFLDSKGKCSDYFEEYLLEESDKPIFIALDEADRIFEFQDVSAEFFGMLRYWHDIAKSIPIWQKLKIGISYSTEAYLAIENVNQSPFANVGVELELEEFTAVEVGRLSRQHQLMFRQPEVEQLMDMVGGHPYLIRKALYVMANENMSLPEFLEIAPTDEGPYGDHLRRHYWLLSRYEEGGNAIKSILAGDRFQDAMVANQLRAAGLVRGNVPNLELRFKIYSTYFNNAMKPQWAR